MDTSTNSLSRERLAELRAVAESVHHPFRWYAAHDLMRGHAMADEDARLIAAMSPSMCLALIAQCEAGLPASGGVSGIKDGANTGGPSVVIMDPEALDEAVRFLHPSNQEHRTPSPAIHRGAQLLRELYGTPKGGDAHPPEPNTKVPRSQMGGASGVSGEDGEWIVRAAIKWGEAVYSVPPPGRHGDVYRVIEADPVADITCDGGPDTQGFLTSTGRFLGRVGAKQCARDAGQLLPTASQSNDLFSEDLW